MAILPTPPSADASAIARVCAKNKKGRCKDQTPTLTHTIRVYDAHHPHHCRQSARGRRAPVRERLDAIAADAAIPVRERQPTRTDEEKARMRDDECDDRLEHAQPHRSFKRKHRAAEEEQDEAKRAAMWARLAYPRVT